MLSTSYFQDRSYESNSLIENDDDIEETTLMEIIPPSDITEYPSGEENTEYYINISTQKRLLYVKTNNSKMFKQELTDSQKTQYVDIVSHEQIFMRPVQLNLAFLFYILSFISALLIIINGMFVIKPISPFFVIGSLFFILTLIVPLIDMRK